jgi:hypothetical protein
MENNSQLYLGVFGIMDHYTVLHFGTCFIARRALVHPPTAVTLSIFGVVDCRPVVFLENFEKKLLNLCYNLAAIWLIPIKKFEHF